jgi:hypothetical protein
MIRFGFGQPAMRKEDESLLRGVGRFALQISV